MNILWYILIAIGGALALWIIFKFLAGCLLRLFLAAALLAVIAILIFSVLRR